METNAGYQYVPPFPTIFKLFTKQYQLLMILGKKLFENIVEKGENAISIFSFSHNVFIPFQNKFQFFSHIFFFFNSASSLNLDQSKICCLVKQTCRYSKSIISIQNPMFWVLNRIVTILMSTYNIGFRGE